MGLEGLLIGGLQCLEQVLCLPAVVAVEAPVAPAGEEQEEQEEKKEVRFETEQRRLTS